MQSKQKTTIIEQLSAAFGRLTTAGVSTCRNTFAAHQSRASVAPNSSVQQPRDNQASEHREDNTAKARCVIPAEPVSKGLKSLATVWQEYRYGTETKPSISQLFNDHGKEWQKSEYGYDRKIWYKKKKVVSAIYAVKHIASVSSTEALKMLEDKRLATLKTSGNGCLGVCEFVEKFLPKLDDKVDVNGKCRSNLESCWRSIIASDPHFDLWQTYISSMRSKFDLNTALL